METCKGKVCPLLSSAESKVRCLEHECAQYQHLIGKHPQTGEPLDHWDCALRWSSILLIENAQQMRQFSAAVESARNEARIDAATMSAALVELTNEVAGGRTRGTVAGLFGRLRELATRKKMLKGG